MTEGGRELCPRIPTCRTWSWGVSPQSFQLEVKHPYHYPASLRRRQKQTNLQLSRSLLRGFCSKSGWAEWRPFIMLSRSVSLPVAYSPLCECDTKYSKSIAGLLSCTVLVCRQSLCPEVPAGHPPSVPAERPRLHPQRPVHHRLLHLDPESQVSSNRTHAHAHAHVPVLGMWITQNFHGRIISWWYESMNRLFDVCRHSQRQPWKIGKISLNILNANKQLPAK